MTRFVLTVALGLTLAIALLLTVGACAEPESVVSPTALPEETPDSPVPTDIGENTSTAPGMEWAVPTATPFISSARNPAWSAPPSIDELIFSSTRIVEATLSSITATTETVDNGAGIASTYRPVHELRFTVSENLMGSGSASVLVVVRGEHTYTTKSAAQAAADERVTYRITTWDDRKAILFLGNVKQPYTSSSLAASQSENTNRFVLLNFDRSSWDYSVEESSRAWLPAQDSSSNSGTGGASAATTRFITGVDVSPPQTIAKSELKSSIATMTQRLSQGKNVPGYEECISGQIAQERHRRAVPWSPYEITTTLASGAAAGAEVYRWTVQALDAPVYLLPWLSGDASDHFRFLVVDGDTSPITGYSMTAETIRPLPPGAYQFRYNLQHPSDVPCNFKPLDSYDLVTVTVTAPSGTLHEAFFDPVAIGTTIGADGTNGVLKPNTFTASDSTTTTLRSIDYSGSNVRMLFSQTTGLSGKEVQFIMVDGTVGLTVPFSSAMVETVASQGTRYSWKTCSAPWAAGEKVMIRIRNTSGSTGSTPSCVSVTPTPDPNATATPIPPPTATPEPTATPTLTPTPAPSAPGSVTPTLKAGNGQMTVSWSPPADNGSTITAYQVQVRQHPGGTWTVRATVSGQARSVKIDKLTPGMVYRVRLRAQNGVGWGKYSWPIPQVTLP